MIPEVGLLHRVKEDFLMKLIRTNNSYKVYEDDMETMDLLPSLYFSLGYDPNVGFFLKETNPLELGVPKLYGDSEAKTDNLLNKFKLINRNLGVMLSGKKGAGKSLFVRLLCNKAVAANIPVIFIKRFYSGIANFLEKIDQGVLVVFDEFDKVFHSFQQQNTLLTLLDGVSAGKKLFVITCNDTNRMSEFLLDRPGRIHYHFKFDNPSVEEVTLYLKDNVLPEYQSEVETVLRNHIAYSFSYDVLRAIVFELNNGLKFTELLDDLNASVDVRDFDILAYDGDKPVYAIPHRVTNLNGSLQSQLFKVMRYSDDVCMLSNSDSCWIEIPHNAIQFGEGNIMSANCDAVKVRKQTGDLKDFSEIKIIPSEADTISFHYSHDNVWSSDDDDDD